MQCKVEYAHAALNGVLVEYLTVKLAADGFVTELSWVDASGTCVLAGAMIAEVAGRWDGGRMHLAIAVRLGLPLHGCPACRIVACNTESAFGARRLALSMAKVRPGSSDSVKPKPPAWASWGEGLATQQLRHRPYDAFESLPIETPLKKWETGFLAGIGQQGIYKTQIERAAELGMHYDGDWNGYSAFQGQVAKRLKEEIDAKFVRDLSIAGSPPIKTPVADLPLKDHGGLLNGLVAHFKPAAFAPHISSVWADYSGLFDPAPPVADLKDHGGLLNDLVAAGSYELQPTEVDYSNPFVGEPHIAAPPKPEPEPEPPPPPPCVRPRRGRINFRVEPD